MRGAKKKLSIPSVRVRLNQIPLVAIKVLEHCHGTVQLLLRFADELDPSGFVGLIVAGKVVGIQKQEHPATGLIADGRHLNVR